MMAKLGPFSRRDNCSVVRGVSEIDYPFVCVAGTCMVVAGAGTGWKPGC